MRVLVTGATGFIGNYVVRESLKQGHQVVTTSRNSEKARTYEWFPQVQYIPYDLNVVQDDLFQLFREPEVVIHLAWEGLPNYKEMFHLERNLPNNYLFLKNMIEHGLKSLVVTGTCSEYGMQSGALNEYLEAKPNNPYALAKDCLRKFLEQLQKKIDFDLKWIRLFYMYGMGQNPNSILSQLGAAIEKGDKVFDMSGGEQLRDYLPVERVAEYIVKISMQDKVTGIINCCSGVAISIRKLVEDFLADKNKTIELNLGFYPYPDHVPMAFWGDSAKLNKILNS